LFFFVHNRKLCILTQQSWNMKKIYLLPICIFLTSACFCQAPYIGTAGGDGLGQYGYIEKDAVTFSRLFRNTYNNIAYLSARWWITDNTIINGNGKEYIYHVYAGPDWVNGIGWQCGGDNDGSKRTTDFIATDFSPEWNAGSDCYVSVCAKYCDDSYYPASFDGTTTNGATGFNERHYRVVDVDTTLHVSTATDIPNSNGVCQTTNAFNVAGSFTINSGASSGTFLTTLLLQNNGTSVEGIDIPNDALHVYYEPATGTEIYGDGNETLAGILTGDWDANTTDNIFGNTALNIPLNGKIRVYVLLCSFNSPVAVGKTINLGIINDGISLAPLLDSYGKLRINPSSISQRTITLPIQFLHFTGSRNNESVNLKWAVSSSDNPNNYLIQYSFDGLHFETAGTRLVNNFFQQSGTYQFVINTSATFFRIVAVSNNGEKKLSNIIRISKSVAATAIRLLQNPVVNTIIVESAAAAPSMYNIKLLDAAGRLWLQQNKLLGAGQNEIEIPQSTSSQVLLLLIEDKIGNIQQFKILKP
jgi:hypothetical protein